MRSIGTWITAVSILFWFSAHPASAQVDHGHFCFQMSPFIDILDLHPVQPDPAIPFYSLGVTWTGDTAYAFDGSGALWQNGSTLSLTTRYGQDTGFFGGNPVGHLYATINPSTLRGPYAFDFQGPNPPFANHGILINVPCESSPALMSETMAAPLAGE